MSRNRGQVGQMESCHAAVYNRVLSFSPNDVINNRFPPTTIPVANAVPRTRRTCLVKPERDAADLQITETGNHCPVAMLCALNAG